MNRERHSARVPSDGDDRTELMLEFLRPVVRNSIAAANAMRQASADGTVKASKPMDDAQWLSVVLEFLLLYVHLVGRQAMEALGETETIALMDQLTTSGLGIAELGGRHCLPPNTVCVVTQRYRALYRERLSQYFRYRKPFPAKGEGAKGTLIHEFGTIVAEVAGHPRSALLVMLAIHLLSTAPDDEDISGFLTRLYLG